MVKYNDNELLYLALEGNPRALKILVEKYEPLILKKIYDFRIKYEKREDFFQEGRLTLLKAISTFSPFYGKTFNKYFLLILERHFIEKLRKESTYFYKTAILEDVFAYEESHVYDQFLMSDLRLNQLEREVFYLKYFEKNSPQLISKKLNLSVRKVYNLLFSIRKKAKNFYERTKNTD